KVWSKARRGYREYLRVTYDQDKAGSRKRTILYNAVDKTTSEDKLGAMVFDRLVKRYSKKSKTVQIGRRSFPAELFDEYRTVLVEGREFKIPKDEETYFKIVYGRKWKTRNSAIFQDTPFRFRDGDHSWEEFQEYIKYLDLDEYYSNVRTIKSYGDEYKIRNRAFRHTIDIKERTHYRFVFWQKYMPIKDKLIELHEKGDMEKLEDILEPYLYELTAFSHKDLTIYFDREIFDIAKDVLRATEREDVADLIETLIPEEHLEPIRIKNYKGEYI
ncbi:MAG: hypothetical protein IJH57_00700, partial [Mogibacterium sp.]|nr:hypothetical protein [Mogibacterium sp.]